MTIKEAFQKLTMACGAALKNPFFVQRNLHDAFAEIADEIVDAGGSTVSVTAELTEGTKIATVTVDGEDTDLYAPEASGINYSTSEQDTGLKWIDGKNIYFKTISGISISDTGISKECNVIKMDTLYEYTTDESTFIGTGSYMGISSTGSKNPLIYIEKGTTNYEITRGGSGTYSNCEIVIYYTKVAS